MIRDTPLFALDEDLLQAVSRAETTGACRVWEPRAATVVLGRSNRVEKEVHLAACAADRVPVVRRLGGGGAVVLASGCVVVSLARRVGRPTAVRDHIEAAVSLVQQGLERVGSPATRRCGTGDLCIGERKILGSSVFRRRDIFFYQASLLVDMDLVLVERYLRHPSREPAYRAGRPHSLFLTTLRRAGVGASVDTVCSALNETLDEGLPSLG